MSCAEENKTTKVKKQNDEKNGGDRCGIATLIKQKTVVRVG